MTRRAYPTWAAWSEDSVLVYRASAGQPEIERLPRRTTAGLRYFVRLFRRSGALFLRSGDGAATRFDATDAAGRFHPVPDWPDRLTTLPLHRVVSLADGGFAGLPEEENIFLFQPGQAVAVRALPPGFRARALDQDEHGRLYAAGSTVTGRLRSMKRRHAFAISLDHGLSWQVDEKAHGRLAIAWHSLLSGAEVEYRTVTAAGRYLVLSAEVGEFGEESTLVFAQDPEGQWTSDVIRNDLFRAALAVGDQAIEIFSHRGMAILVDATGRHRLDLAPRIARSLAEMDASPPASARYEILGVDAQGTDIAVLVSIQAPGAQGLVRFGEAILTFGAEADRVVHLQRAPAPEVVSVCWGVAGRGP